MLNEYGRSLTGGKHCGHTTLYFSRFNAEHRRLRRKCGRENDMSAVFSETLRILERLRLDAFYSRQYKYIEVLVLDLIVHMQHPFADSTLFEDFWMQKSEISAYRIGKN